MLKKIIGISLVALSASTLSACKISADWERTVSAQLSNENRVEWLQDMKTTSRGTAVVAVQTIATGANRTVDILLSELDASGHALWQEVFDLGENERVSQLLTRDQNYYVLSNTPNGESQLLAVNTQGQQQWLYRYQDGVARSMKRIGDKLYITGKRTQVLNSQGQLLIDIHQDEATWAIETGLLGDFYVASTQGVSAYDARGNQLWFKALPQRDLSLQLDLMWQAGALYLASVEQDSGKAWITKVNTHSGTFEWQQAVSSPAQGFNSLLGPVLMAAPATGHILLVQSYDRGRQITQLSHAGDVQWQARQEGGIARDVALNADDELLITGSGITEQFATQGSDRGQRIAWANLAGQAQETTGEIEVSGKSIYVGASVYRDGRIQAVITHYTDQ